MESKEMRKAALKLWISDYCGLSTEGFQDLVPDASFRRYFRINTQAGSFIAMDAPPDRENCAAYIAIANALRKLGLKTPEIIKQDMERGFLLISDFGDHTYLKVLNEQNANNLYTSALNALALMQTCEYVDGYSVSRFDEAWLSQEWQWHKQWFAKALLHLPMEGNDNRLDTCFEYIAATILSQPFTFMHRDFHSANLMALAHGEVGILDFQDAFIGPITYDLVSLLRDCYIDWSDAFVLALIKQYWYTLQDLGLVNHSFETFKRWFDFTGIERHLKALFTFSRKACRDQQTSYLQYVPRTLNYLVKATEIYDELLPMHEYIKRQAIPAFEARGLLCVP